MKILIIFIFNLLFIQYDLFADENDIWSTKTCNVRFSTTKPISFKPGRTESIIITILSRLKLINTHQLASLSLKLPDDLFVTEKTKFSFKNKTYSCVMGAKKLLVINSIMSDSPKKNITVTSDSCDRNQFKSLIDNQRLSLICKSEVDNFQMSLDVLCCKQENNNCSEIKMDSSNKDIFEQYFKILGINKECDTASDLNQEEKSYKNIKPQKKKSILI